MSMTNELMGMRNAVINRLRTRNTQIQMYCMEMNTFNRDLDCLDFTTPCAAKTRDEALGYYNHAMEVIACATYLHS